MKNKPYRQRVGQLLWLARCARLDLSYQVNALARVAHNPTTGYLVSANEDGSNVLSFGSSQQKKWHCRRRSLNGMLLWRQQRTQCTSAIHSVIQNCHVQN